MKTDTTWFALEITVNSPVAEAMEFALNELGAIGTEINNLGRNKKDSVCVIGYFEEKLDEENLKFEILDSLRIHGFDQDELKTIVWRKVENRDWLAEWKRHWKPTEIAHFIIAPPWSEVEPGDGIVIRIEPNMAFGTGTHETTQLCLTAISENYSSGKSFLDVGTGTGILAIAAAKLTTEHTENIENKIGKVLLPPVAKILACDVDLDSVKIARENAAINGVSDRIDFFDGSISKTTPKFDFVCANLTIDVIVPLLELLIGKTTGILLLSGILVEQETTIREQLLKFQISNLEINQAGEWISVLVRFS